MAVVVISLVFGVVGGFLLVKDVVQHPRKYSNGPDGFQISDILLACLTVCLVPVVLAAYIALAELPHYCLRCTLSEMFFYLPSFFTIALWHIPMGMLSVFLLYSFGVFGNG